VLSRAERATLADELSELRALGLVQGAPDLERLQSQADQSSTVGFYDTDTKKLYVEGTQLSPYVRVTVVHELTHALQDQRLGLSRLDGLPDDQQPAVSALVEGDAVIVEQDYQSSFTPREQQSYEAENNSLGSSAPVGLPDFLSDENGFPYDFGPTFVDALVADGGNDRVDQAFRHPPVTAAEILDPSLYLEGWSPRTVHAPQIPVGARELEPPSEFGQLALADMLGTRLGYSAWSAVQGWSGDSSVLYRQAGQACVAIDTVFSTAAQADAFDAAARSWSSSLTGAQVARLADGVDVRACDPGPGATTPQRALPAGPSLYDGLVARADLMDSLVGSDVPSAAQAECVTDRMIGILGISSAVAYDQGGDGAPSDAQLSATEKTAEGACPRS
jgi:hypothetical protein